LKKSFCRPGIIAAALAGLFCIASNADAASIGGLPFDIDVNSLVSDDVVKALVNLIGFSLQHRPYEPATPLGTAVGLDISVEATMIKIPDGFFQTMASSGFPLGTTPIPSLPMAKLHLHKGFGDVFDLGGSALYLLGNKVLGADAKFVFLQGEEGPTYAFRFCYTYTDLSVSGINISTKTLSPQILMSRQMEFADPYLGVAFEYALGDLDGAAPTSVTANLPPGITIPPVHKSASAFGGMAFGGVSLKIPRSGLRITLEGSYNTAGTSSMGLKTGFTF
jgi:hypothetical protein